MIRLAESALKKGLDEGNTQFAKELIVSACIQRGTNYSSEVLHLPPDPNWREIRRVALEDLEKALSIDPKQPQSLLLVAQLNLLPGGDVEAGPQGPGRGRRAAAPISPRCRPRP